MNHKGALLKLNTSKRTFIVRTVETVEGIYHVEAESAEQAQREFEADPRHWGTQMSYSAFEVDVRSVEEAR